jgi:hypothetical protein
MWGTGLTVQDRKQLKVWLSSSCIESIWKHVGDKYPYYKKGQLGEETEFLINLGLTAYKKSKSEEKHTHTNSNSNSQFKDELLELRDRIVIELTGKTQVREQEVLDIIKLLEGLRDNRPAKDRLRLLIAKGCCTESKSVGKVKLIKFPLTAKPTPEVASKEFETILARYGDMR